MKMHAITDTDFRGVDFEEYIGSVPTGFYASPFEADSEVIYYRDNLADSSGSTPVYNLHNYAYLNTGRVFFLTVQDDELDVTPDNFANGVVSLHQLAGSVLSLDTELDRSVEIAFQGLFSNDTEELL